MERSYYVLRDGFKKGVSLSGVPHGLQSLILQKKTFFKKEVKVIFSNSMFIYTENGKTFYEFFSSERVGEMRDRNDHYTGRWLFRSDYPLASFEDQSDYGTAVYDIVPTTATEFADLVKEYMPYRDHISKQVRLFFASFDKALAEEKKMSNLSKISESSREEESSIWLDSVIGKK